MSEQDPIKVKPDMNKRTFVHVLKVWLADNNIPIDKVYVSFQGALLLHGDIETTNTIDLVVEADVFDKFENVEATFSDDYYMKLIGDNIFLHMSNKLVCALPLENYEGVKYTSVPDTTKHRIVLFESFSEGLEPWM